MKEEHDYEFEYERGSDILDSCGCLIVMLMAFGLIVLICEACN